MNRNLLLSLLFLSVELNIIAQTIGGGAYHSMAICSDGTVRSWGDGLYGQLGDGSNLTRLTAVPVSNLSNVISIESGYVFSLFLKNDGTVWASGDNSDGQLGDGTYTDKNTAVQVSGLTGIIDIAAGEFHSLFLKIDGTVWACGYNNKGQLGDGTLANKNTPIQISGLSGIVEIAAGYQHSLFLKDDGTVWACGTNGYGELGDGTIIAKHIPVQVSGLTDIIAISGGAEHSLFLKNDGTVWSCGRNDDGELGIGNNVLKTVPNQVTTVTGVIAIATGHSHSIFLQNDGTAWACGFNTAGALGDGSLVSWNDPVQVSGITGVTAIEGGHNHSLFLKNDSTLWACGKNQYGRLGDGTTTNRYTPVQTINLCQVMQPPIPEYSHFISGYLYGDANGDCIKQTNEQTFSQIFINSTPGSLYSLSNDSGYYYVGIRDSINYIVEPIIPQRFSHFIQNPCPTSYSVYLNSSDPIDTSGFDFGFDFAPCYQLRVDVTANRKRRCSRNITSVYYVNEGLVAVNGVEVRVKFDSYDIPLSASIPYVIDPSDSSLVFNIGNLNPGQFGSINITDSISCLNFITGLTQCTKAWILPPNTCLIDSTTGSTWDLSSIMVEGDCLNDTVRFVIHNKSNNSNGNMTGPSEYRIYADNFLMQTVSFQLNGEDSLVVPIVSNGATIRLEADQRPGHPGYSHPSETIEACGTNASGNFSIGQVNQLPMDDEDVNVEIDCMEIRDSYDPNYKDNSPLGVGTDHLILPNTLLDYVLHFQNTGSDTAYKVVIIDTLSEYFDITTLEPGVSSHPYTLSMVGGNNFILKFTFDNIFLVDSFTNEPLSHGFVKFKIAPKVNTLLGTIINNSCDIYFDYNLPVKTNTAFVTLDINSTLSLENKSISNGEITIYPNPTAGKFQVQSLNDQIEQIEVYNFLGEKLKILNLYESTVVIDLSNFSDGIYFIHCNTNNGSQILKLIKN